MSGMTPPQERREDAATRWNRVRYNLYSPIYDAIVRFERPRRRSIELLALCAGERVLLVGAGTGADLPLIPPGIDVLATELAPAMLARAAGKRPGTRLEVMDGQCLALPDASFDAVILHLVLAVIPDPAACLREAARVLAPGGRVAVFDKFLPDGARPGVWRRLVNAGARVVATDINRQLAAILRASGAPLAVEHDEPALLGGVFRLVLLRRSP
jgi:phosphatidylethanolamine/phosphatidyl-N-methylethanolamine N-methyltransferase